jgi:hypothetical protein
MSPILSTITSGSLIRGNSSIISNQLVLHYNFGIPASYNGSGRVNSLAQTYTGTVTGASFSSTPPAYLSFNGTNNWITVPASAGSFESNNALSIETWAYPLRFDVDPNNPSISSVLVGRGIQLPFFLEFTNPVSPNSARPRYRIQSSGQSRSVSAPNISINNWYHIVGTYSSNLLKIYVNNVETSLIIPTSTLVTSAGAPLTIGTYELFANSFSYNGRIGEVRIYKKELSAIEVAQNYNSTKFKYGL